MKTLAIVALLLWSAPAMADRLRVHLAIDDCLAAHEEIARVVAIELPDLVAVEPDLAGTGMHATVRCEASMAVLHVDDPVTQRSMWRRVALPAEPRLIALALAELISASWTELAPAPAPPPPRVEEPARVTAAAPPSNVDVTRAPRRHRAMVSVGAQRFSADTNALVGFGARYTGPARGSFGWMIDAQAHGIRRTMSLGEIATDVYALGTAAQFQASTGRVRVDLGAGVRGGAVHMSGMPAATAQGGAFWSPWFGPLALGNVALLATERIALEASAEVGRVVSPVTALVDGQRAAAVDGTWFQFHVGIALLL